MTASTLSGKASEKAHSVIDQLESTAASVEERVKEAAADAGVTAEDLTTEAREQAMQSLSKVETFVREKPVQAAGIAFAAGILTAMFLRRK